MDCMTCAHYLICAEISIYSQQIRYILLILIIFKLILVIDGWATSNEIAFRWMSLDFTDERSTLEQLVALVPSGKKSLAEPMLTHVYVAIWRDKAPMDN